MSDKMPTEAANHFAAAFNLAEVLIAAGRGTVHMIDVDGTPTPKIEPDWFLTLSISPPAALVLREVLNGAIGAYEKAFGKIPAAPDFRVNVNTSRE